MGAMASQITSPTISYSTVYSGKDKKKTSKFRVTGLCEGNSPVTGEFPTQKASNVENVSIWWRHHVRSFCQESQEEWRTDHQHPANNSLQLRNIYDKEKGKQEANYYREETTWYTHQNLAT